ncbi:MULTISPECIES: ABC transporter permease [unclassified Streptomyces]|uniref:ABC transporter permease n=1 Tax=unclassified Streptomyces TaxID=2593676 RepID=UPI0001C198BE|nr:MULTISPECIES: ABC transporter permease [unclassified Streptomyces]AEN14069.1 binding-protein-dependent transport systems inner membrane component [Streptomyces sp. SirexAA-E]MYR67706.1 ABC transporter permease subunit [Streptomyces sp. SID4939]MYS00473.1 ABC transporter permease subunit [Streptomyces sp. SID4940]MYT67957.1 ABC transporter permease subunit [Streptomyces sp. SID8357]MYT86800.1 ABC transporter permease subunit [Streptomyces sp. SID8360]
MAEALLVKEAGSVTVPASGARPFWRRLRRRRSALVAAVVVALLVLVALAAPLLSGIEGQNPTAYHPDLVDSATGGVPLGSFGGISGDHWLGVEPLTGRDLFARVAYGARVSLGVALGATLLQVVIGVGIGLSAGLGNRFVDQALSRLTDVVVALPVMVIALGALAVVPAGFPRPVLIALIVGLVGWSGISKIVRAQTLALKSLDHVAAARLSGWGPWQIARRELLPALAAPVITYAVLLFPSNIVVEAALSFLGVGIKPPTPSWGQMLSDADTWYQAAPTYLLVPALLLFVTVLALTVLGEGVRTALDPRAESRLRIGTRSKKEAGA